MNMINNSYLENQSTHFSLLQGSMKLIHDFEIENYQLNINTCKDLFDELIDQKNQSSPQDYRIDQTVEITISPHQHSQQGCKCSKIDCLKMYCECFSKGRICTDRCECINCCNHQQCLMQIRRAQQMINFKNPGTFNGGSALSIRRCTCKKSECRKKYCECYRTGMKCSQECECIDCQNGKNGIKNFFLCQMQIEVNA